MSESLADFISHLNEDFSCYCSRSLGDCGISQGQISFLLYIGDHPNCSPMEVAQAVDADTGYTTRSIKKLEACGMAVRERHTTDRRAYVLRLTDAGMDKFYEVRTMREEWEAEIMGPLDESERAMFMSILAKLRIL